jgi:DNA-binding transcriptional regulator LsrR (DeoR family)
MANREMQSRFLRFRANAGFLKAELRNKNRVNVGCGRTLESEVKQLPRKKGYAFREAHQLGGKKPALAVPSHNPQIITSSSS